MAGIDLGKATAVKFNTVSVRVGSPIFIDLIEDGLRIKCVKCGNVYSFDKLRATAHLRLVGSFWQQYCNNCGHEARLAMVSNDAVEIAKAFGVYE